MKVLSCCLGVLFPLCSVAQETSPFQKTGNRQKNDTKELISHNSQLVPTPSEATHKQKLENPKPAVQGEAKSTAQQPSTLVAQNKSSNQQQLAYFKQRYLTTPQKERIFGLVWGDPAKTPYTLLVFTSIGCPYCSTFHNEVLSKLQEQVSKGRLSIIQRDYPTNFSSLLFSTFSWHNPKIAERVMKMLIGDAQALNQKITASKEKNIGDAIKNIIVEKMQHNDLLSEDAKNDIEATDREIKEVVKELEKGLPLNNTSNALMQRIFQQRIPDKEHFGIQTVPSVFLYQKEPESLQQLNKPDLTSILSSIGE